MNSEQIIKESSLKLKESYRRAHEDNQSQRKETAAVNMALKDVANRADN